MEEKKAVILKGSKRTDIKGVTKPFRLQFAAKNPKKKARKLAKRENLLKGWFYFIAKTPTRIGERFEFQKTLDEMLNK